MSAESLGQAASCHQSSADPRNSQILTTSAMWLFSLAGQRQFSLSTYPQWIWLSRFIFDFFYTYIIFQSYRIGVAFYKNSLILSNKIRKRINWFVQSKFRLNIILTIIGIPPLIMIQRLKSSFYPLRKKAFQLSLNNLLGRLWPTFISAVRIVMDEVNLNSLAIYLFPTFYVKISTDHSRSQLVESHRKFSVFLPQSWSKWPKL